MKRMEIIVSTTDGLASFADNYFNEDDAEAMKKFAESKGYSVTLSKTAKRFGNYLNPLRRENIRDIDWTDPEVYATIIRLRERPDNEICEALGSEGSGMAITTKFKRIFNATEQYKKTKGRDLTAKDVEEIAKLLASQNKKSNTAIRNNIIKLQNKGCDVGLGEKFPECEAGFHKDCFICPANQEAGKLIKDEIDLKRYNKTLKEEDDKLFDYEDDEK